MKIYVITKGEYSDYHICAVTEDEKIAEKLQRIFSDWDKAKIEEYDTDNYSIERYKNFLEGRLLYVVAFSSLGDVDDVWMSDEADIWVNGKVYNNPYSEEISISVDAPNKETAIKIAAERRAEYLAEKNGIV